MMVAKEVLKMGKLIPVCFFCEEIPTQGFASGIFLFKKFLCTKCQEKILDVASDDEEYELVLQKVRQLWHEHPQEKKKLMNQKSY